jgi:transcriptional regulator GlxA family with amidase domain
VPESPRPLISPNLSALIAYHPRLLRVANQLMDQDMLGEMDLAAAASLACMERTAFSRFFRSATGITFVAFRRLVRVQKAMEMISSSDVSVTEIASAVGFAGVASFERAFKCLVGITPSGYRRRLLSELKSAGGTPRWEASFARASGTTITDIQGAVSGRRPGNLT